MINFVLRFDFVSLQSQLRIDSFFRLAQQDKKAIRSQRVRRAVTCMRRKEKEEEESEVLEATAVMEQELKQRKGNVSGQGLEQGLAAVQSQKGKRKKRPPPKGDSSLRGGFIGEVHLSEASSSSSVEDLENETLNRCKRGKSTKALKANQVIKEEGPPEDEAEHSSSSMEEEMNLVTARPVFEGKKARGRSLRGRRKQ